VQLFAFTFAALVLAFAAMALGVLLGRAPLRRACGGLGGAGCEACPGPCPHRKSGPRGGAGP
jgi:hypothetical protein